ncbi:MAG TPA: hypothetical protein VIN93_02275 [Bryobacteraceae bacterium]
MLLVAVFAIVWAVIRACVQSITMDEADTYAWFVATSNVWYPFSNNHILNTLLMWVSTGAFGPSIIAIRAPSLLGAALYIGICHFLSRSITERFSIQLPLFICLTYNPFIFDYMVAARGYGLANAFLLAAIAVPVWHRVKSRPSLRQPCALASLALGLSFSANYSFAFADLAVFLAITAWAIRRRAGQSVLRIVGFCVLPGLFVALLMCGYPMMHWWGYDYGIGAHSLREMRQSLVQSSLYRLDPRFRDTGWYKAMSFLRPLLPPVLVVLCFCRIVAAWLDGSWREDGRARWLGRFTAALAGIVTLCVLMHWLAFRFYRLPLPLGRAGIFLLPLCTLLGGVIVAAPARSLASQWLRRGLAAVSLCLALYFLLCLRLSYFKEYQWDADAKEVYSVLARYNHTYGITDVGTFDLYFPSLNYYRALSKRETFPEFKPEPPNPPADKSIYVMSRVNQRSFIDKEKLVVVYRGKFSDTVIAVKPDGPIPPTVIDP